jgi:hypothetical protein
MTASNRLATSKQARSRWLQASPAPFAKTAGFVLAVLLLAMTSGWVAPLLAQNLVFDMEAATLVDNSNYDPVAQTGRLFDEFSNPLNTVKAKDYRDNNLTYETQVHNGGLGPVIDFNLSRVGSACLRFDLRDSPLTGSDGVNRRSEIWVHGSREPRDPFGKISDIPRIPFNTYRWYGFSFKLHPSFQKNSQWIISQWWQNAPDNGSPGVPGEPVLDIFVAANGMGTQSDLTLNMSARHNHSNGTFGKQLTSFNVGNPYSIVRDKWYDVLVEYRFRPGNAGQSFARWFISPSFGTGSSSYVMIGERLNTRIGYWGDDANQDGVALKFGVYSSKLRNANPNSILDDTKYNTMWFDQVRSGTTKTFVDPKQ